MPNAIEVSKNFIQIGAIAPSTKQSIEPSEAFGIGEVSGYLWVCDRREVYLYRHFNSFWHSTDWFE